MNENIPDSRSGAAFDRERLLALSSIPRNSSREINLAYLVSSH
jgi:hypothetical protein